MGFSRQEYWSWLPFPSSGNLSNRGIKPRSSAFRVDALPSEPPGKLASPRQKLEAKSIGLDTGERTEGESEIILRFFTGATRMLTVVFTEKLDINEKPVGRLVIQEG